MKKSVLVVAVAWVGCGPSLEPAGVMTPEERIREQERLAYEQELAASQRGMDPSIELDEEEDKPFDSVQAKLELRRASGSAHTCVDVVQAENMPKGEADVTIVFGRDGGVRDVTLSAPFAGSPLEECVLNAYRAVIVPPFDQPEHTVSWRVDLTGEKRDLMVEEGNDKESAVFGGGSGDEDNEE